MKKHGNGIMNSLEKNTSNDNPAIRSRLFHAMFLIKKDTTRQPTMIGNGIIRKLIVLERKKNMEYLSFQRNIFKKLNGLPKNIEI